MVTKWAVLNWGLRVLRILPQICRTQIFIQKLITSIIFVGINLQLEWPIQEQLYYQTFVRQLLYFIHGIWKIGLYVLFSQLQCFHVFPLLFLSILPPPPKKSLKRKKGWTGILTGRARIMQGKIIIDIVYLQRRRISCNPKLFSQASSRK